MCKTPFLAVFDDGDERTLRRTSLCLKGGRHFNESEVSLMAFVVEHVPESHLY